MPIDREHAGKNHTLGACEMTSESAKSITFASNFLFIVQTHWNDFFGYLQDSSVNYIAEINGSLHIDR